MSKPAPEATSAEAFARYAGGKCLRASRGKAWREIKACIVAPPRETDAVTAPAVSEPFLAWVASGEIDFHERDDDSTPWLTHRIKKGSFFLTTGGAPYQCRWKAVTPEPFHAMFVFLELPLLQRALEEIFGADAARVQLRDVSAFQYPVLNGLMERLRDELMLQQASPLLVQGIAQATAVHLARNFTEKLKERSPSPSLPGFKLRQITDWMAENVAEEFRLEQLAVQAGLSKFHFTRLFKSAIGLSPSRYQLNLRIDAARRLLRETRKSVVEVALEVGYNNPSRFAQLFRRETGLTPSDYRRQR